MKWWVEDESFMKDVKNGGNIISNYQDFDDECHFLEYALPLDSVFSTHPYSTHPPQWPPPVEVADKWEWPSVVSERFDASGAEGISSCGIFPEIRRAWASVDNSIFIWPFDKWFVICADASWFYIKAAATPKCNPFCKGSRMGSVLSTIQEKKSFALLAWPNLNLVFSLKLYSIHLFWQPLQRSGAVDPAIEMVFDGKRNVLYVRTEARKLQVFVLGKNGGSLRKVAEERNFIKPKDPSFGGTHPTCGGSGGSSTPSIVSISPLSFLESYSMQLLVVLSDGRRMYCRTCDYEDDDSRNILSEPNCLRVVSIRPSPLGDLSDGSVPLVGHTEKNDIPVKFDTSYYSAGTLVLSNSSSSAVSSVTIVTKDYSTSLPKAGNIGTLVHTSRALWESVYSLPVDGNILFVADVPPLPDIAMTLDYHYSKYDDLDFHSSCEVMVKETAKLWSRRDLSLQHLLPRRRVIVFSSMGMMELVFNRPVDILRRLLESNSEKVALEYFFNRHGTAEAASMCLMLAANIADNESDNENVTGNIVFDKAAEAYENAIFVPNSEPSFSGAYEGLCFCSARLLGPLWRHSSIMTCKSCSDSSWVIECKISVGAMKVFENKLRSLEKFLKSRKVKKKGVYAWVASPSVEAGDSSTSRTVFAAMEVGKSIKDFLLLPIIIDCQPQS